MLVSILIPCYNAERWIAESIESALAQTWPEKEVIVVDDGSTDGSLEVIKKFGAHIRWETGPNLGGNAARNRLLELANGEWLQYLDSDDYLLPPKIAHHACFALKHSDSDVIYSPVVWEHMENGVIVSTETEILQPYDPWIHLALWQLPQTGGAFWKKEALLRVGGWRSDQMCCQEHELYCRLLETGSRFAYVEGCFAVYRDWQHGPRVTNQLSREVYHQRLAILDRVETFLLETNQLTTIRRQAINDGRHAIARSLWRTDTRAGCEALLRIHDSDNSFVPTTGPASPRLYSIVYRLFGFRRAQAIAAWKRAIAP